MQFATCAESEPRYAPMESEVARVDLFILYRQLVGLERCLQTEIR